MIPVGRVEEPSDFERHVGLPGRRWLADHPQSSNRPPDTWKRYLPALEVGFGIRCGYSAIRIPYGTVDHFVSINEDRQLTYEWSNYRYALSLLNSIKQNVKASRLLDPFEVEAGWFEILLPSLQLVATNRIPEAKREQANFMLNRLGLGHDERMIRLRRVWYADYESGLLSIAALDEYAPLIAAAVRKRDQRSTIGA